MNESLRLSNSIIFMAFRELQPGVQRRRAIFKYFFACFFSCYFLLFAAPHISKAAPPGSRLFPYPIKESEIRVVDWLERRGFSLQRTRLKTGVLEINGLKNREQWRIFLTPRSSLATRIIADYSIAGKLEPEKIRELWSSLAVNIKRPGSEDHPNSSQFVPAEILLHMESVACIRAQLDDREVQFSGFIINRNGLIICTAHDLEGIQKIYVSLFDGREYGARIIKKDLRRDLMLVRINLKLDSFIPFKEGRNLIGMGEQLYTVGCPVSLGGTVHSGFVNGPPRRVEGLPLWQVDLDILPGSSGSPVFDIQGNLVGMVKGRYRGTKSVGFLIPIETMTAFMKER